MNPERLAEMSGADLSAVGMDYVAAEPYSFGSARLPWRRYGESRAWQSTLSEPYDLFINFTHGFPPFCHAREGVLVVLFPFHERPRLWVRGEGPSDSGLRLWSGLKRLYHDWEWQRRMETYQIKTAISRFSQVWTKRRWGIDCEIIYPPVANCFRPGLKTNTILSVGRFTSTGPSKRQLEMMAAFDELNIPARRDWEYYSVGGLTGSDVDLQYFESVSRMAQHCRAQAIVNVERGLLKRLFARTKIFWHAAGYKEDDGRPELSEHFGIATVEAMSAGCVPVVINKGGQPEIVRHGESGFVWDKLEELREYTELLMRDEPLRARMAEAARTRASLFSRERFVNRFLNVVKASLSTCV
jgi:glycosyltransferase involved in cell wall biosynthesis